MRCFLFFLVASCAFCFGQYEPRRGGGSWGSIGGDISAQEDLSGALGNLLPTRAGLINWKGWQGPNFFRGGIIRPDASYDSGSAVEPSVYIAEDGKIYVFYAGLSNTNTWSICLATGYSFANLSKQGTVLSKGTGGDFDAGYVSGPRIKKFTHSGTTQFYLYYFGAATGTNAAVGYEDEPASISVATASSPDGPWTKTGIQLITTGTAGGWEDVTIYRPDVIEKDGVYHLFYNAKSDSSGIEDIGLATGPSPLGPFTKYAGNPVVTHGESWAAVRINDPYIVPVQDGYMMFYGGNTDFGSNPPRIGAAFSPDLLNWTEYPANPIPVRFPNDMLMEAGWRPEVFRLGSEWVMIYDASNSISIAKALPFSIPSAATALQSQGDAQTIYRQLRPGDSTGLAYSGIVSGTNPSTATIFYGRRSRGTLTSPEAVASGDYTARILGGGYDGSTMRNTAGIRTEVAGTVASGTMPQQVVISTGTAALAVDRVWVKPDGKVGVGTSSPSVQFGVSGTIQADAVIAPNLPIFGEQSLSVTSGTVAANMSLGNVILVSSTSSFVFTASGGVSGSPMSIVVTNSGTAHPIVTFSGTWRQLMASGTAVVITGTGGQKDEISFRRTGAGNIYEINGIAPAIQ